MAEEQAALRRVATLVARGAPPPDVFTAVAQELARLLGAGITKVLRFEPDDTLTVVGGWAEPGMRIIPIGTRLTVAGDGVSAAMLRTGRPARAERFAGPPGSVAECFGRAGVRTGVGSPIMVEGHLWGLAIAGSARPEPLPADSESRIEGFTELAATAIANAQARLELRAVAEEQAALRRVATLVARGTQPRAVFAAVAEEAGQVLDTDFTILSRYEPGGAATVMAGWARTGAAHPLPVGERVELGGLNVSTLVFDGRRPARIDDYNDASGAYATAARRAEMRSAVGAPISVEGQLWGVMIVASTRAEPLRADTEARLAGFTELVATAIANAQARVELRGHADGEAALRRVATLVARAAPPEEVFATVAAEAGRLLHADFTVMSRYAPDGAATILGIWNAAGSAPARQVGTRMAARGRNVQSRVFQTGRPARIDDYTAASGETAEAAREAGFRSAVGVPVSVEGRLWGIMGVGSAKDEPLPADTEARLAAFTELVATAIANAEIQAALTASRARIVATADATRRRIERDLHDGAQQHLVSLALHLREAQAAAPSEAGELAGELDSAVIEVNGVLDELREIARGLHPAILADGGLRPALKALARRAAVPVRLDVRVDGRLPEPVEIAAYYAVSEALTNTVKHAVASAADVEAAICDGLLHICVRDDGHGGAAFGPGSGLVGLKDRVEALGGRIWLHSPPGVGTAVDIALPLAGPPGPGPAAGVTNEAGR
jgi:signal transduction histidine kinase